MPDCRFQGCVYMSFRAYRKVVYIVSQDGSSVVGQRYSSIETTSDWLSMFPAAVIIKPEAWRAVSLVPGTEGGIMVSNNSSITKLISHALAKLGALSLRHNPIMRYVTFIKRTYVITTSERCKRMRKECCCPYTFPNEIV